MAGRWRLSKILPGILLAFVALELGFRAVPPGWIAFRDWEAVKARSHPGSPFMPNQRFASSHTHGDLVNFLRPEERPAPEPPRAETFTTDRWGYRDPATIARPVSVILLGSSFTAGSGVDDRETLAAQLADLTGRGVYNAGAMDLSLPVVDSVRGRLHVGDGFVVAEVLEANTPVTGDYAHEPPPPCAGSAGVRRQACLAREAWGDFSRYSPLRILLQRGERGLGLERRAPGPAEALAVPARLANGRTVLLRPHWLARRTLPVEPSVATLSGLARELERRRLHLVVLLVPNKETVYGPLLERPTATPAEADAYLYALAAALRAQGLTVVNAGPVYRRDAARLLLSDEYLYFPDDTHWNAVGIGLAAGEVAAVIGKAR